MFAHHFRAENLAIFLGLLLSPEVTVSTDFSVPNLPYFSRLNPCTLITYT